LLVEKPIGLFFLYRGSFDSCPDDSFGMGFDTKNLGEVQDVQGFGVLVFSVLILGPLPRLDGETDSLVAVVVDGDNAAARPLIEIKADRDNPPGTAVSRRVG
jgi:hypothetical protein